MMDFRFGVRPVNEIAPAGGERPGLSWFWLTDGWYNIELGSHELLRYSERSLRRWREEYGYDDGPYVTYQVVRLWEDVLDVVSAVMEPVPEDLVDFVSGAGSDWLDVDTREAEAAADWYGDHTLTMIHLTNPPTLRWWRTVVGDEDTVTVTWANAPHDEVEFNDPVRGRVTMPTNSFVTAVTEFDRALLAAMEQRIQEIEASGPPPGVHIDMKHLRYEQQDRGTWLAKAWARPSHTDWNVIRDGARALHPAGATPTQRIADPGSE